MGVNSLPKTVTRHRRDYDSNPGPSAPESSTLTTRLPSHPENNKIQYNVTSDDHLSRWTTSNAITRLLREHLTQATGHLVVAFIVTLERRNAPAAERI